MAARADPRITINGLTSVSSALTFTAEEAAINGYSDGIAPDLESVLTQLGFGPGTRIVEMSPTIAEDTVRLLTNPITAAFLFAGDLILIIDDLLSGGISLLSAGGVVLMTIFFWGIYRQGWPAGKASPSLPSDWRCWPSRRSSCPDLALQASPEPSACLAASSSH